MAEKHWYVPIPTRPTCPVCKKAVYSRGGIHPQCAMIQADPRKAKKPDPTTLPDPLLPK